MGVVALAGWQSALALDPGALGSQPWRLCTWPLAHLNTPHLLWDASAFVVLGILVEPKGRARFWAFLGASAFVSGAVWCLSHDQTLLGASGLASALFTAAALALAAEKAAAFLPRFLGTLALVLFLGKLLAEALTGTALFSGGAAAWSVHATSSLAAATIWILFRVYDERRQEAPIL